MFEGLPDKKKKGGRLVKGSPEAAAWGKMMRERRMGKPVVGGDILGDLANAFDPNKNGVAQAFNPDTIKEALSPKKVVSTLIYKGVPYVTGSLGGATGDVLTETRLNFFLSHFFCAPSSPLPT